MPYYSKGKCIYKKGTDEKVGCTKGSIKKYMKAIHANVKESLNECYDYKNTVVTDDRSEASVFFNLTKAPGGEIGLVFSLPEIDYQYGVIKDPATKQLHKFEDPRDPESKKLLKMFELTPEDIENEMYQQAYEHIESQEQEASVDDGVRIESLDFENLFAQIMNLEKESKI
jgi:hypothetical protein